MSCASANRREFFRSAAGLAAAGAAAPYWFTGENARADESKAKNDRPHVGLIGCGGRGTGVAGQAARFGQIVALCDVDSRQIDKARARLGDKARVYDDYRKLLEQKDIDAVVNGTPDHWHTAVNIAACRAGKDVYAEKPITLTIDEGKLLRKVVNETGRIVQVGTQQRSTPHFRLACELVRNGRLGKLQRVTVMLPFWTTKGGPFKPQPVPPELNWDFYQGQAPLRPYYPERTHFNFRWWFEYAGGIITDWGQHHMGIAYWGMDMDRSGPLTVEGTATFPNQGKPHCFNNPDRFVVDMTFPGGVKLHYHVVEDQSKRNGIMFEGDKGRILVNRAKDGLHGKPVEELKDNPLPADAVRLYESNDHMANFFDCIKTRKQPVSPVDAEHRVITACHLGNIAIRLKRKITWDAEKERITGDDEANAWLAREQRPPYLVGP